MKSLSSIPFLRVRGIRKRWLLSSISVLVVILTVLVIAHKVQDNSRSSRILFLHALNKVFINKHKLTSLQNSDGQHPGGCCP